VRVIDRSDLDMQSQRIAAVAGGLFVILLLLSNFVTPAAPSRGPFSAQIVRYYNHNHTGLLLAGYLAGLSIVLFFLFLGGLRSMLQPAEGGTETLSAAAYAAGVVFTAVALIATAVTITVVFTLHKEGLPDLRIIRALYDMNHQILHLIFFPTAALIGISSLAMLGRRAFPAWLAPAGFVIAVMSLIAAGGLFADTSNLVTSLSLIVYLLFSLWVLVVSAVMFRRAPATEMG